MSSEYQFPCTKCERSFRVEIAQAGRTVPCPFCKESQELPKLSEMRRLPTPFDDDESEYKPSSSSGTTEKMGLAQTWMFVLGLPLILIGGGVGGYQWLQADGKQKELDGIDLTSKIEEINERIDSQTPEQLWTLWHDEILERPPVVWKQSQPLYLKQQVGVHRLIAYFGFGAAAIGLGLTVFAVMTGSRKE